MWNIIKRQSILVKVANLKPLVDIYRNLFKLQIFQITSSYAKVYFRQSTIPTKKSYKFKKKLNILHLQY